MRLPPGTSLAELRREQRHLAAAVSRRNGFRTVRTVAGVDVAYAGDHGFAAVVVLRATDLAVIETAVAARAVDFPYVPGYLAYREFPLIEAAYARLREPPSILLVDGHGQIHPARCGVACMVGIRLGVPTIGVAKSPLVGRTERTPHVGEAVPVRERGEVLGYAFRPGPSIRLLYISTGHRVAPRTAVRIVRDLCRTRGPEPLRLADSLARENKENKGKMSKGGSLLAPIPGGERPKARRIGA